MSISIYQHPMLRSSVYVRAVVALLMVVAVALSWWPSFQQTADSHVEAGLKRALVTFAIARSLNAAISVAQETEVSIQPLGFGVTLAPGQVLDPINDLVESFSELMLVASIVFGVQKMLLMLFGSTAVSLAVTVVSAAWLALFFIGRVPGALTKLLVVILVVRVGFPLVLVANEQIHQQLVKPEYETSTASFKEVTKELEVNSNLEQEEILPAPDGESEPSVEEEKPKRKWWSFGKAGEVIKDVAKNGKDLLVMKPLREKFAAQKQKLEAQSERIIRLMAIFVLETVIIPLGLLWLLWRLMGLPMNALGSRAVKAEDA